MKKILSAIVISTFVLSATGCGSAAPKESKAPEEAAVETTDANAEGKEESMAENAEAESDTEAEDVMKKNPEEASNTSYEEVLISDELDEAIGSTIIEMNRQSTENSEFAAEGHIVIDLKETKNSATVYLLTTYGEYEFINGDFVRVKGTVDGDPTPAVVTYDYDKDDGYTFTSYEIPVSGSESVYESSVKELFPEKDVDRIFRKTPQDLKELEKMERRQAKRYLNKLGREAEILSIDDIDLEYPKLEFEETSNAVFNRYWEYPEWIGTKETIENDVRYVYETQWKDYGGGDSLIYLTKYVQETGEIIKTINVHVENNEVQLSEESVLKMVAPINHKEEEH